MFKRYSLILLLVLSFAVSAAYAADPIGKIISKTEADSSFGNVLISVSMTKENVVEFQNKCTTNVIMFDISDSKLRVLDGNRQPILNVDSPVKDTDVFHVYSMSKVQELLSLSADSNVLFEVRENVFSITSGDYTLEFGNPCPPICIGN